MHVTKLALAWTKSSEKMNYFSLHGLNEPDWIKLWLIKLILDHDKSFNWFCIANEN